jgi:hypothetical protein
MEVKDITNDTNVLKDLMPPYEDIPDEFKDWYNPWCELQSTWFFSGLKDYTFVPKEGIDQKKAIRHLGAVQGSWDSQHEHKQATVAYLLSQWFDDVLDPDGKSVIKKEAKNES